MSRAVLVLANDMVRHRAIEWIKRAPNDTRVEFKERKRSLGQNDLMWLRLTEIAQSVDWYGERLRPEEWKDVFTAALRKARVVPGVDGGFVVLGLSTSDMSKEEMTNLLELIAAFASQHNVELTA